MIDPKDPGSEEAASTIPHDLSAEQALLGVLMFDNERIHDVADQVRGFDFYEPFHQRLFDGIVATVRAGRLAEPSYLTNFFSGDPAFEEFGGLGYLANLLDHAPPGSQAKHYAEIVSDMALRRYMMTVAGEALKSAQDYQETALDLVLAAERAMGEISASTSIKSAFEDIGTVYARQLQRSKEMLGRSPGIPIGIPEYDKKVGGLRPKTVNVFAGRPGAGKSAVGVEIALNIARPSIERLQGLGVAFYSLEMPEEQVATRFGCALAYDRENVIDEHGKSANPTYEEFEAGTLTEDQWRRLEKAGQELERLPIHIDFRSKLKISQIMASVRRLKRDWERQGIKPGVIIIDHVLQVAPEKTINDKVQEISQIADDTLDMAKLLDMPVVLLAQLGRDVDKREDKRPGLADLKWSGTLEEVAATVTFLYRPEYYNKRPEHDAPEKAWAIYNKTKSRWTNRILFLLGKNRGGRSNQEFELFCDIGSNVIRNLASFDATGTIDFSKARTSEPGEFDGALDTAD